MCGVTKKNKQKKTYSQLYLIDYLYITVTFSLQFAERSQTRQGAQI